MRFDLNRDLGLKRIYIIKPGVNGKGRQSDLQK